jgi:hypothetical protein
LRVCIKTDRDTKVFFWKILSLQVYVVRSKIVVHGDFYIGLPIAAKAEVGGEAEILVFSHIVGGVQVIHEVDVFGIVEAIPAHIPGTKKHGNFIVRNELLLRIGPGSNKK